MTPVTTTPRLTPTAVDVLAHIYRCRETRQSNAQLADVARCSTRAVRGALTQLEDAGLIAVERRRRNSAAGDPTGRTLAITNYGREVLAALIREAGF
jgi:DNA-binding MarR family transcriptional regulator